jgi:hypothetical protein
MTRKKITSKIDVTAGYQSAINGVTEYLPNRTLVLNGKPVTSKAVVGLLQAQIDAVQASAAAHTAWLQAVAKERAVTKSTSAPLLAALRHYVAAVFGVGSDEYLAFGFQPPKARIKSPAAKVVGAEKMRATRKARNTMGSQQRLEITGTVPSVIALPTGTTSTTATVAAPAQPLPIAATPVAASAQPAETVTVTTSTNGVAATQK